MSKQVEVIPWEEPPPKSEVDWEGIAAQCRADPMRWAKVAERMPKTRVNSARQGDVAAVRRGLGFEFTTRNNSPKNGENPTCTLFVRWNPDKVDPLVEAVHDSKRGA